MLERVEPPGKGVWGCGGGHGMGGDHLGLMVCPPPMLSFPQDSSQIGLLKELLDLQKDMVVMLLSLLEGGVPLSLSPPTLGCPGPLCCHGCPNVTQCPPAIQGVLAIPCHLGLGHPIHHPGSPNDTHGPRITGGGTHTRHPQDEVSSPSRLSPRHQGCPLSLRVSPRSPGCSPPPMVAHAT